MGNELARQQQPKSPPFETRAFSDARFFRMDSNSSRITDNNGVDDDDVDDDAMIQSNDGTQDNWIEGQHMMIVVYSSFLIKLVVCRVAGNSPTIIASKLHEISSRRRE